MRLTVRELFHGLVEILETTKYVGKTGCSPETSNHLEHIISLEEERNALLLL